MCIHVAVCSAGEYPKPHIVITIIKKCAHITISIPIEIASYDPSINIMNLKI